MTNPNFDPYQNFIATSRYSRFLPSKKRRETWDETVRRYVWFFHEKFNMSEKNLGKDPMVLDLFPTEEIYEVIYNLEVMPSMRALMTAGKALAKDNAGGFNCSFVTVDDQRAFDEVMYILMVGCGVGFSVERQYINKLPEVAEEFHPTETVIKVRDSKIGWASSFRELISLLYGGHIPTWDLSALRPAGAPLKTFGGRSSGPGPLDELFRFAVATFRKAAGRRLSSLECHDLMCKIGDVVVSGGVRRSALISLSNLSDERMRSAKSGQWWLEHPHRALSNNSVAYTEKPDIGQFMVEWHSLYESKSGERGIFNRVAAKNKAKATGRRNPNHEFSPNPCAEILLRPQEFCNLTEVVVRESDTLDDLKRKVRLAVIMGTFQSTLTDFRYLRNIWKRNCDEERLLGVSLTGIMDHPVLNTPDEDLRLWLRDLKEYAVEVNKEWAEKLGINQSVACTTVKPSGCTTLDTKIRTTTGIRSMFDIFEKNIPSLSTSSPLTIPSEQWIIPKEDIFVYDENNEEQIVSKLFINGLVEVFEIESEDGRKYKFTGNHKLKTTTGWKRVDSLTVDDELISFI